MTAMPGVAVNEPARRESANPAEQPALEPASRIEPPAVSARQLAELLSISLRTVRTWDCLGRIPMGITIGGRKLWRLDEIRAWLSAGAPDRSEWEVRKGNTRKLI